MSSFKGVGRTLSGAVVPANDPTRDDTPAVKEEFKDDDEYADAVDDGGGGDDDEEYVYDPEEMAVEAAELQPGEYELEDESGNVTIVKSDEGAASALALQNADDEVIANARKDKEYEKNGVHAVARFVAVIQHAQASAHVPGELLISSDQFAKIDAPRRCVRVIECANGIWEADKTKSRRLRRMDRQEAEEKGLRNPCSCEVCENNRKFEASLQDAEMVAGTLRSGQGFKLDEGRTVGN